MVRRDTAVAAAAAVVVVVLLIYVERGVSGSRAA